MMAYHIVRVHATALDASHACSPEDNIESREMALFRCQMERRSSPLHTAHSHAVSASGCERVSASIGARYLVNNVDASTGLHQCLSSAGVALVAGHHQRCLAVLVTQIGICQAPPGHNEPGMPCALQGRISPAPPSNSSAWSVSACPASAAMAAGVALASSSPTSVAAPHCMSFQTHAWWVGELPVAVALQASPLLCLPSTAR